MKCMIKTATQQDLLLYAYNECNLNESDSIQRSIDGDPLVQDEFNELLSTFNLLNDSLLEPAEKSIEKILAFSRKH
jgi:hypothetical protein